MSHARYFLVAPGAAEGERVTLEGAEFHHLVRVVRAREGESVFLLDGRGSVLEARIRSIGPRAAALEIVGSLVAPEPPRVDMAIGVAKAHALDLAVEKLTEIGVRRIVPFVSVRSVWRGDRESASEKVERLRRKAAAACKQSGQPYLPAIETVVSFEELVCMIPGYRRVYAADPDGTAVVWSAGGGRAERDILGIVGPEGGLDPSEGERLLAAGASPVSLGPFRLRSETAAVCLLFLLAAGGEPPGDGAPEAESER